MSSEFSSLVRGELTTNITYPNEQVAKWRQKPERLAWIVLLSSFAIFIVFLMIWVILTILMVFANGKITAIMIKTFWVTVVVVEFVSKRKVESGIGKHIRWKGDFCFIEIEKRRRLNIEN